MLLLSAAGALRAEVRVSGSGGADGGDDAYSAAGVGEVAGQITVARGANAAAWARAVRDAGLADSQLVHIGPLQSNDVTGTVGGDAEKAVRGSLGGWCCTTSGGQSYTIGAS